jgi:hypothetical protein
VDAVVYIGEEALAKTSREPSKSLVEDGISQIKVFKSTSDIEREDNLVAAKMKIEDAVKKEFEEMWPG